MMRQKCLPETNPQVLGRQLPARMVHTAMAVPKYDTAMVARPTAVPITPPMTLIMLKIAIPTSPFRKAWTIAWKSLTAPMMP